MKDLDLDIAGRDVVLVEDIVDTGLTLGLPARRAAAGANPRRSRCARLLDKPAAASCPRRCDFVGFEVPDEFVLGYGLDFAGRYRNLDVVVAGDLEALAEPIPTPTWRSCTADVRPRFPGQTRGARTER